MCNKWDEIIGCLLDKIATSLKTNELGVDHVTGAVHVLKEVVEAKSMLDMLEMQRS